LQFRALFGQDKRILTSNCAIKNKEQKFPIAVKAGSSIVKIYRDRKPAGDYFRVVYHLGGKRHRLNFPNLEAAKTEASAKAAQLARGDMDAVQLTGRDRLVYGRALDAIHGLGVSLDAAAIEYAEARKVLGGHSLADSSRFFMRHHGKGISGKLVTDAVEAFKDEKRTEGRSNLYIVDLDYRLDAFSKAFNVEVRQLTPADIRDFMGTLRFSARSFNNHRRALQTFFRFCQAQGWLSKDSDLLESVGKRKEQSADIDIFTPQELRLLLGAATPKTATCIALQAFAGVRSEELLRLTWKDVERRKGFVEISAGKAKTAQRRLIPISATLERWLAIAPRNGDMVWPHSKPFLFEAMRVAATNAKMPWKANGLRHSFISYRLAATKDMAAVALEAGNSPAMIFRHYRELATESEAKEWFGIVPTTGKKNILSITEAA
jgi:integrase